MLGLLHLLLVITYVLCARVKIVKFTCEMRIKQAPTFRNMYPAKATSGNIGQLVMALQLCKIDRAQVAGWNDHDGNYILHSNGALTPADGVDLPNVALFFETNRFNVPAVICVVNPDDPNRRVCCMPTAVVSTQRTCEVELPNPEGVNPCVSHGNTWESSSCGTPCASASPSTCTTQDTVYPTPPPCKNPATNCTPLPCNVLDGKPQPCFNVRICKKFVYPAVCSGRVQKIPLVIHCHSTGRKSSTELHTWRTRYCNSLVGYPERLHLVYKVLCKRFQRNIELFFDDCFNLLLRHCGRWYRVHILSGAIKIVPFYPERVAQVVNLYSIDLGIRC